MIFIKKIELVIKKSFLGSRNIQGFALIRAVLFYCSDFRYESNGIFVLGVGFFYKWN